MKVFIAAFLIIVGMSAAYAGGLMLLHVGDANGNGGAGVNCGTGVIDLSTGCTQPMFGGL